MESRRSRAIRLAAAQGIDKETFCQKTGFSPDQWHYWFGSGARSTSPSLDQFQHICECLDWSANYVFFGFGDLSLKAERENSDGSSLRHRLQRIDQSLSEQSKTLKQLVKRFPS